MSSYAIRQEINTQVILFAIARTLYALPGILRTLAAYLVSWLPAILLALKFVASVAVLVGALALTVTFPGVVMCGFVIVCVAVVSKPR
jgi:hypothetical protein